MPIDPVPAGRINASSRRPIPNPAFLPGGTGGLLVAAVLPLVFCQCSGVSGLRKESSDAYFRGDDRQAITFVEAGARTESGVGGDSSVAFLSVPNWQMERHNTPLLALERSILALRGGDPERSSMLLNRALPVLEERRIDSVEEFLATTDCGLASDVMTAQGQLEFDPAPFEELNAQAFAALSALLGGDGDAAKAAEQVASLQEQLRTSDPRLMTAEVEPDHGFREMALPHYIAGVVLEACGALQQAQGAYRTAQGIEGDNPLIAKALGATSAGAQRGTDQGTLHVIYMLGRGPNATQGTLRLNATDPFATTAVQLVREQITGMRQQGMMEEGPYQLGDDEILALLAEPMPMAVPAELPRQVPHVGPLTIRGRALKVEATPVADFHNIAERQLQAERLQQISRVLLRRSLRDIFLKSEASGFIRFFAGMGLSVVETADDRTWSNLPAEVHALRLDVPAGTHTLDVGFPGFSTDVDVSAGGSTCVLVMHPGGPTSRPTILVDRASQAGGSRMGTAGTNGR